MLPKINGKRKLWVVLRRFYAILAVSAILWGCAVKPDTVMIKDTSTIVAADTIIAAETGQAVSFDQLANHLKSIQIIYVGESHTNPSHHAIQLKIIKALFKDNPFLVVGMEMFDRTYQPVLDSWSTGALDEETFLRKVHWYANWRFDFSLYRDILFYIKENRIKMVALNMPVYIPSRIRVGGIENISDANKKFLPREIDTSNTAHRNYVENVFNRHHFKGRVKFEDFYMAQCAWDEVMAESIASDLGTQQIVVLAGNGHIQYKYGIPERAFRRTGAPFRTIYPASTGAEIELEIGDFIWVTPKN